MNKNLTLVSLMLGVMLVSLGIVSAYGCPNYCDQDWLEITDLNLDGADQVTVLPNESINAEVEVDTHGWWWSSTKYEIEGQPSVCVNVPEYSYYSGIHTEDFDITAPSEVGEYDFQVKVYQWEGCNDEEDDAILIDGIIVVEPEPETCEVTVLSPIEGEFYDPLWINWTYSGDCDPSTYTLQYGPNCDGPQWTSFDTVDSDNIPMSSWWDPAEDNVESGEYCIRVRMDQGDGSHVSGYSGMWYLDLAPPYVNMTIGYPHIEGECTEAEGHCYVNQNTEVTLTCSDDNPDEEWQSGDDTIMYQINGGNIQEYEGPFSFTEDSEHDLEYWCYDEVGKESDHKTKDFYVNSEGPTINSTVSFPKVSADGLYNNAFEWFVNGDTKICLDMTKGNPEHPTPGDITIECGYDWWIDFGCFNWSGYKDVILDQDGCFSYTEDSFHVLTCETRDALGNTETFTEKDIVNLMTPTTSLTFEDPYYKEGYSEWIDTVSTVNLTAEKGNLGHPTPGDLTTYYRVEEAEDDWMCETWDVMIVPTDKSDESWMEYTGPFGIEEEGCYMIEYYSEDALNNSETSKVEFVFSDHTAPELDLDVGESGKNCDSLFVSCDEDWDWKVTMDTPITISCEDQGDYQSGVDEICYTIYWDGSEETPTTNCSSSNEVTLWFTESCEHRVEYTCTDNVNKTSSDSQVFKVIGEDFTIELDQKWNLISVPVNLLSSSVVDVFGDDENIEEIWSYENGDWLYYIPGDSSSTLSTIVPGKGYWVKTSGSTDIVVGGSLFQEAVIPNSVALSEGWNLIGHYGAADKSAYCSLFSLVDTNIGFPRWSSVIGYDSSNPSNPFSGLDNSDIMEAGKGYWVEIDVEDNYNYATNCWGYY